MLNKYEEMCMKNNHYVKSIELCIKCKKEKPYYLNPVYCQKCYKILTKYEKYGINTPNGIYLKCPFCKETKFKSVIDITDHIKFKCVLNEDSKINQTS